MELIKWFEDNGFSTVSEGVEKLKDDLGVKVKSYDDRHVFNYSQIESPKTHPVVMECRGAILSDDFSVICRSFDRFFNLGEAPEVTEKVNLSRGVVMEKLDGSLVKVYHDGEDWQVATRGTAYAEGENYTGQTFRDLFVRGFGCSSLKELREKLDSRMKKGWTHIFEFTSPDNRIVTPYEEDRMYLIGVRNNKDFTEIRPEGLQFIADMMREELGLNVHSPELFDINDSEVLRMAANDLKDLREGFVVYDPESGQRVKVKSEQYVSVHRIRGEACLTPKRIIELVVTNEFEEYLAYFPEDQKKFGPYVQQWENMKKEIYETFETHKDTEDQKEFALRVKHLPYSGILFQARSKGQDPIHVLSSSQATQRAKVFTNFLD